jgi:HK97 family phage prohead protease
MLPVILSHNWNDIQAHIGYANPKDVKETPRGLEVKAHLDVNESATARRVHQLMKRGQLTAMSFGYTVPSGGQEMDEKGVNEVSEIELHEVGPTLVGANAEAQLQAVKALEFEAKAKEELMGKAPWTPGDETTTVVPTRNNDHDLRKQAEREEREQIEKDLPPSLPDEEAKEYSELIDSIRGLDPERRAKV